jgi:hypothetical protein
MVPPPVYCSADDGEWVGLRATIRQSAQEASVVIIDSDEEDDDALDL